MNRSFSQFEATGGGAYNWKGFSVTHQETGMTCDVGGVCMCDVSQD